ncbi:hypothetical protein B0T16DRAFT_229744 [Cercophora newfieldiana]|uniref:Complex I intermediate-associated protein 84 n=1 Tax=Cercophora newfieldiana TaxID=92897 RepID=A0AA39XS93_9PEZI|nr:hypothetical protein B0T16DRAFT_229744 [Cercophora newfieldiana]
MRSQLTRNVYRRLLAGHGLLRQCPAPFGRCYHFQCRPQLPVQQTLLRHPSRRTFLGLFQKPPRELKEPDLDPGYDVLLKFRGMETENARPPPRDELIKGLRRFLEHRKRTTRQPLNSTHAFLITRLVRHLVENPPEAEGENADDDISINLLRDILYLIRRTPRGKTANHLELSKLVYDEIEWRNEATKGTIQGGNLLRFLEVLSKYGGSLEAVERLRQYRARLAAENRTDEAIADMWLQVLRGLAWEGREAELLAEYQKAAEEGVTYSPLVHEVMTGFYAEQDKVEETKQWFEKPIEGGQAPTPATFLEILRFSQRNEMQKWGQSIFEKLMQSKPEKDLWDVAFRWSVLAMDKGVEDIKQMMNTMEKGSGHKPDATTIDYLLAAAIEKNNPYLAERFLSLGVELGIEPQAMTYILQMNYRLDARDFSGAHAVYHKLQNREIDVRDREDLPVLNKYLRLLCTVEQPDLERILDITAHIEMRHDILEPETIVALCMVFLRTDQQYDVIDTLSLHTVTLSLDERALVRKAFVEYCLDTTVSTARVWDAYSLLRQFFPETEPADRIRLMDAFFARNRPDMACNIFGHMRGHANPAQRPTADVYVRALEGIGRHPNLEALRMVHNMLKMDTTIEVSTRIRNGLMIAYAAVGDPLTALEFWEQIAASSEGPSYNSLATVFWACERMDARDETARKIWQKMQRMDLEVPPNVFWSYLGALASQGKLNEVKRLIAGMDASVGYSPSLMTLGVTYNALPAPAKPMFEDWGREEYPEVWARLESKGRKKTMMGDEFKIVRNMEA